MITYKSVPDCNKSCPVPSLISFYLKIMIKVKLLIESLFMSCHWPKYDESLSVFNGTILHHLRFLFFPSVVLSTPGGSGWLSSDEDQHSRWVWRVQQSHFTWQYSTYKEWGLLVRRCLAQVWLILGSCCWCLWRLLCLWGEASVAYLMGQRHQYMK